MKMLILLFTIMALYNCTNATRSTEGPGGTPPRASPARASSSRASPSRASLPRASPSRASLPRASPSRGTLLRASTSRASLPRENSSVVPAVPDILPANARVFLQNTDGEVFSGRLTYMSGISIPEWVFGPNQGANRVENVYIRMPNGDGLLSNIQPVRHNIDINDEIPPEHRSFIFYGNGNILIAVLQRYEEYPQGRPTGPTVYVRIPQENDRYSGVLEHFSGHRPKWLE